MKTLIIFIVGLLAGVSSIIFVELYSSNSTEVWTATKNLESDDGLIIPAGTKLIVHNYMQEGFVALNLGINVEGKELDAFTKETIDKLQLRAPVWVAESNSIDSGIQYK